MNVIFLDIDGVLNSANSIQNMPNELCYIDDEKIKLLKEIVEKTEAKLVLSSSWRAGFTLVNANNTSKVDNSKYYFIFCAKLLDYGLSLLSEIPRDIGCSREDNIVSWLHEWPGEKVEHYVILDDDESKFSKTNEHLVFINHEEGLQRKHVEQCVHMLQCDTDATQKKMLIVDDILVNREIIKEYFESDFTIFIADNGVEALEVLKTHNDIDIMITDIVMPLMDGFELIKKVREQSIYNNMAIIANTQYGELQQEEKLIDIGANDFVYKPSSPKILTYRVQNMMKIKKAGEFYVKSK